jgi:hypothetical protein
MDHITVAGAADAYKCDPCPIGRPRGNEPYFPLVCRHVLKRDFSVPLTFFAFDVLRREAVDLMAKPYSERREELD